MTSSKPCPVCKETLTNPPPGFCPRCGWELQTDITFAPALDLPDAVVAAYEQRLAVARRVWREREAMRKALAEAQALAERRVEPEPAPEKIRKPQGGAVYSENTPAPDLSRDVFETPEEFAERIKSHQPVPAGRGELIKEEYDIATGRFPLKIVWSDWAGRLSGGGLPEKGHVTADRQAARAMWEAGPAYPVYARLTAKGETAAVEAFELSDGSWALPLKPVSTPTGGTEWRCPVTGMVFVQIPPGEFVMGSPEDEPGRFGNEKQHRVRITKGFWLGKYPVTQTQWKAVTGENPSYFKNAGPDAPVEVVSWNDAQAFIKELNRREGSNKYRLPTEAEWEYACRAGSAAALYSGPIKILGANNAPALDPIAWYAGNSGVDYQGGADSSGWEEKQYDHKTAGPHPVGRKKPNAWGLQDMLGNVWEWCMDIYRTDICETGISVDPIYTDGGTNRVLRGGAWFNYARYARCARRLGSDPGNRDSFIGFRLARML